MRHGSDDGLVTLGGVRISRPRLRTADKGAEVAARTRSVSKSAVSRRFVAMTESALLELMDADLFALDLVTIMIDGANFGEHRLVVALGIGIDGSTALPPAIRAVFDHPVIAWCEEHKVRNVRRHLPKDIAHVVERHTRAAYRNPNDLAGQGDLEALAKELQRQHPGAAGGLGEGLAETFTISLLGVPPTLARRLRSTKAISVNRPSPPVSWLAT